MTYTHDIHFLPSKFVINHVTLIINSNNKYYSFTAVLVAIQTRHLKKKILFMCIT